MTSGCSFVQVAICHLVINLNIFRVHLFFTCHSRCSTYFKVCTWLWSWWIYQHFWNSKFRLVFIFVAIIIVNKWIQMTEWTLKQVDLRVKLIDFAAIVTVVLFEGIDQLFHSIINTFQFQPGALMFWWKRILFFWSTQNCLFFLWWT